MEIKKRLLPIPDIRTFLSALVFFTLLSGPAYAEKIPASAEPEIYIRSLPKQKIPVKPLELKEVVPESPQAIPIDADNISLTLAAIHFDGITAYTADQLRPLYQALVGHQVSLRALYQLADAITAKYQQDGYLLSVAVMPAQEIRRGVVRIKVIEGKLDRILVNQKGDAHINVALVQHLLRQMTLSEPLNIHELERNLLIINNLPGLSIKTVLKASPSQQGTADLYVMLQQTSVDVAASLDNRGSQYLGPERLNIQVAGNSLLGRSEQITFGFNTTEVVSRLSGNDKGRFNYLSLGYREPVGGSGQQWFIGANVGKSDPAPVDALAGLDIDSTYQQYRLGLSWPLIYQRDQRLMMQGSLDYQQAETRLFNEVITRDRVRSIRMGGFYQFVDAWQGRSALQLELSKGLNILNASSHNDSLKSRAEGHSDYWKLNVSANRAQWITPRLELLLSASGQRSGTELLAPEEFALGGVGLGGAYDSGELTGDHGIALRTQLSLWGLGSSQLMQQLGLYGYYDIGAVWDKSDGRYQRSSLAATGAGLNLSLGDVSLNMELAMPLTRYVENERAAGHGRGARFFFSVTGSW